MCTTCGCGALETPRVTPEELALALSGTLSPVALTPAPAEARRIAFEHDLLDRNRTLAGRNRAHFAERRITAVNLLSAPGSGKTTLLERTIREHGGSRPIHVIEGDQATTLDADRVRQAGAPVVQVNTGAGCHLDADMIERAAGQLDPQPGSLLLIENVGNLVCPALFDLGERARVVIASVTEGHDKPLKYPHMFRGCDLVLLNKIDLLPWVPFDPQKFEAALRQVNPSARIVAVSALKGTGLAEWYGWLAAVGEAA